MINPVQFGKTIITTPLDQKSDVLNILSLEISNLDLDLKKFDIEVREQGDHFELTISRPDDNEDSVEKEFRLTESIAINSLIHLAFSRINSLVTPLEIKTDLPQDYSDQFLSRGKDVKPLN